MSDRRRDHRLAALLKDWDQIPAGAVAPPAPITVTAESLALGSDLYAGSCTTCHGPDGQGTPRAPALERQELSDRHD